MTETTPNPPTMPEINLSDAQTVLTRGRLDRSTPDSNLIAQVADTINVQWKTHLQVVHGMIDDLHAEIAQLRKWAASAPGTAPPAKPEPEPDAKPEAPTPANDTSTAASNALLASDEPKPDQPDDGGAGDDDETKPAPEEVRFDPLHEGPLQPIPQAPDFIPGQNPAIPPPTEPDPENAPANPAATPPATPPEPAEPAAPPHQEPDKMSPDENTTTPAHEPIHAAAAYWQLEAA